MSIVSHFKANTVGRDFVVGDIHGCFRLLDEQMEVVSFDKSKDRLFSVGDLVDRGPDSDEVMSWLSEPWFFPIRGNHEQMAIDYVTGAIEGHMLAINGGTWFLRLSEGEQKSIAERFSDLPFAATVDVMGWLVGLVHAEPWGNNWMEFQKALTAGNQGAVNTAIWARSRIMKPSGDHYIRGVSRVYVGHTPLSEPQSLGNIRYIDTGAFYTGRLTMVEMTGKYAELQ